MVTGSLYFPTVCSSIGCVYSPGHLPYPSVDVEVRCRFPVSMCSYLVREHIPRHAVGYYLSRINPELIWFIFSSIYALTASRLQCGLVIVLSTSALLLGIVTTATIWSQVANPNS
jgi:hypothetical protein